MEKMLIPYTFNILAHILSFSWQIYHLKNVDMYTLGGGGGEGGVASEKVHVLFIHLNVDNYGRPLMYIRIKV